MAHELTIREDGKVEMAYTGQDPWHWKETRPTKLPVNATIEQWIEAAGMDWEVRSTPVLFAPGTDPGINVQMPDRNVLFRSDSEKALGVVSDDYQIVQPREVLEFFNDLVASVGLTLETAGTLFGGRRFWALAKIGEQALIEDRDPIKGYLLLTTSADGTRATEARFTSVRVVCNNTLSMSHEQDTAGQVRITHRSKFVPDNIKQKLGVAPKSFETFMTKMRDLADKRVPEFKAFTMTKDLLHLKDGDEIKKSKQFSKVMDLFHGLAKGHGIAGTAGTAYAWLNAVTEASDHYSKAQSDSHRLYNALMGPGEKLKSRAFEMALAV